MIVSIGIARRAQTYDDTVDNQKIAFEGRSGVAHPVGSFDDE